MRDPQKNKTFHPHPSLSPSFSPILPYARCVHAVHCCIKKKWNGARKWNIRVVKSGGRWIFIVRDETWIHPRAFESILGSFHRFEIGRLSLSAVSSGLYSRVTARIEWKHSLSFSSRFVSSRLVSSHGTVLPPLSRFASHPLRLITIYYARYRPKLRVTRPCNFARISVGLSRQTTLQNAVPYSLPRALPR